MISSDFVTLSGSSYPCWPIRPLESDFMIRYRLTAELRARCRVGLNETRVEGERWCYPPLGRRRIAQSSRCDTCWNGECTRRPFRLYRNCPPPDLRYIVNDRRSEPLRRTATAVAGDDPPRAMSKGRPIPEQRPLYRLSRQRPVRREERWLVAISKRARLV